MYLRNRLFSSGLVAIVGLSFMFVSPDLLAQGSLFQQKKNASLENQDESFAKHNSLFFFLFFFIVLMFC